MFHALHLYIPHYCFPAAVLRNTTYQNNSIVTLEDIGEGYDALLCITNQTACCQPSYTGGSALGNWFSPNGTRVPSPGNQWDFYRTRGQMVTSLHRRRGGVEGIYCCEIPVTMIVTQTIYIGVYSASTGEWSILFCSYSRTSKQRTLWEQVFCPLFRGCPYLGGSIV